MKTFEVAYYEKGTLIEERYQAEFEMQVKAYFNRKYKRQVKLEYIKEVEAENA